MEFGYDYQNPEAPKAVTTTFTTSMVVDEFSSSSSSDGLRRFLFYVHSFVGQKPTQTDAVKNQVLEMKSSNENVSIVLLVICLVIIPFVFMYLLSNNINMYQQHKFKSRYGNLFEDVHLRNKW